MNILIVYAHPEPKSFNGAMYRQAKETLEALGHQVQVSDLYAMKFDPVSGPHNFVKLATPDFFKQQKEELNATSLGSFAPELNAEQEKVEWCDLMIWQFPLWWFSVPGILKGWVDRVFAMGRAYGQGHLYENGMFNHKRALLSLTTGGGRLDYQDGGLQGEISGILRPLQRGILEFTGFSVLAPHVVYGPARLTPEDRTNELNKWQRRLEHIEQESPIVVGHYH